MQLSIGLATSGLSEIITSHGGEQLVWRGNTYNRLRIDPDNFFNDINAYWEELPFGQQTEIWNVYKKMHFMITNTKNVQELHNGLRQLVTQMYELHPMERLNYWMRLKSRVKYPETLKDTYDPELPKEMTYLRTDYTGLLTIVLALRVVLPVFSTYISAAEQAAGNAFKEHVTMKLIDGSALDEYPPMQRLAEYVTYLSQNDQIKSSLSVLLGGLGTAQIPRYLLALAVIRRVAIAELKTQGEPVNIVSNVWHYVSSTARDIDKRFGGTTKFKDGNDSGGEDDKQSVAETYKMKQEVAEATTIPDSLFLMEYIDPARQIDPTVSMDYIQAMWNHQRVMTTFSPSEFQMTMTGWVMAPVISARSVMYLEQDALMRAISISQALLWHWGYPDLAALMTASPAPRGIGESEGLMSRGYRPPTKDMLKELDEIYPYWKRVSRKGERTPESNFALQAIRKVFQDIDNTDWVLKAPKELLAKITMEEYETGYASPRDLEFQLVDFVIKNYKRKYNKVPTGVQ
jgi:hypothetical protein